MAKRSNNPPPATLTVFGVLHDLVFEAAGHLYTLRVRSGQLVAGVPPFEGEDCRELYILRPRGKVGGVRESDMLIRAIDLYERFTMRGANEIHNARLPRFHAPRFCGAIKILRYVQEKHHPGVPMQQVTWDHVFKVEADGVPEGTIIGHDQDGEPIAVGDPAHAPFYQLSRDQFYVPPGPWKATARGIQYASLDDGETSVDELSALGGLL